ncbi:MAG: response regulator [Oligoflexales bacterium]
MEDKSLDVTSEIKPKRILLVDDDPVYSTIIDRVAKQEGLSLDWFQSLEDLGSVGAIGKYDGAIIDINLGVSCVNGIEIADYIDALDFQLPVIIVSESDLDKKRALPSCVRKFLPKSIGYQAVVWEVQKHTAHYKGNLSKYLTKNPLIS